MTTLTDSLTIALKSNDRVQILYKGGEIHKGRIFRLNGSYYIAYNSRSLVMTRVNLEAIVYIRYTNSRVYLFRALGRR